VTKITPPALTGMPPGAASVSKTRVLAASFTAHRALAFVVEHAANSDKGVGTLWRQMNKNHRQGAEMGRAHTAREARRQSTSTPQMPNTPSGSRSTGATTGCSPNRSASVHRRTNGGFSTITRECSHSTADRGADPFSRDSRHLTTSGSLGYPC
jgi:hypothetical protein